MEPFQPKKGVHIETDPKADKKAQPSARDDESVIENLISRLSEAKSALPQGYKLSPVQVGGRVARGRGRWERGKRSASKPPGNTNLHMDMVAAATTPSLLLPHITPFPASPHLSCPHRSLRRTTTPTSTWR